MFSEVALQTKTHMSTHSKKHLHYLRLHTQLHFYKTCHTRPLTIYE